MLSGGGLMLPHPEAPRFLTLILSANRRFPLGSLTPSSDAVSRGIPASYFSRPRTLYSIPFNFSTVQPTTESRTGFLYPLSIPFQAPLSFFDWIGSTVSWLCSTNVNLNSFDELLIPRD